MSLLASFIDSRTIAGLTASQTTTFAHDLPAAPDYAIVQQIATAATNGVGGLDVRHDATNVTVRNNAGAPSPDMRIITVVAHSIVR